MPKYLSFFILSLLIVLLGIASIQLWTPAEDTDQLYFTTAEREWLTDHPVIKVAIDPDFAPYEFYDGNTAQGIAMEYLEYIEFQYNIDFEITHFTSWTDSLSAIRNGDADILSAVVQSPQRDTFMLFTEPYSTIQNVVLIRNDMSDNFVDTDLASMHVAVIKDYFAQDLLELHYPGIELYKAADISDGLRSLSLGQVDAFVVDSAQSSYYIPKIGANNLKMNRNISLGFDLPLHFGVRKDAPELRNILSKTINSIPPEIHEQILHHWDTNAYEPGVNSSLYILIIALAGAIILAAALMVIWNTTLNKQVERKTRDMRVEIQNRMILENQLNDLINAIPYPVSVKDHKGIYIYANKAYGDLISISASKIIGAQDTELYNISPSVNSTLMTDGDEAVLKRNTPYTIRAFEISHLGARKVYDVTKLPFVFDDEMPSGILSFFVDITQQYDNQSDLKQLNEHLEDIVEQRVAEFTEKNNSLIHSLDTLQTSEHSLIDLNNELTTSLNVLKRTQDKLVEVEKFAALGRSASAIAHEMNTPLGIGISTVSFAISEIKALTGMNDFERASSKNIVDRLDQVQESLSLVDSSVSKMLYITRSLDKLTSEQWGENPTSFILRPLIETAYESATKKALESLPDMSGPIDFQLHCDSEFALYASEDAYKTIFESLVLNTLIHGFVPYKDPKFIRIRCYFKDKKLTIHYEDNGIGVKSDDLSKILEPLHTTRRGNGYLGLGLSIIYNIVVNNLNGKMNVYNLEQGGLAVDLEIRMP